eukprot:11759068-Prorocentrum_lima.AAC.1
MHFKTKEEVIKNRGDDSGAFNKLKELAERNRALLAQGHQFLHPAFALTNLRYSKVLLESPRHCALGALAPLPGSEVWRRA